MNEFLLEEKHTKTSSQRKIQAKFSDNAVDIGAALVSGQHPLGRLVPRSVELPGQMQKTPAQSDGEVQNAGSQTELATDEGEQLALPAPTETASPLLESFFQIGNDGDLIPRRKDYKGPKKKDQQQRFILVYVWAHELAFKSEATRDHLMAAAKKQGLYDQNMYANLRTVAAHYLFGGDGGYQLNPAGKDLVDQIMKEMDDETLTGFPYWDSKSKRGGKSTPRGTKEALAQARQWAQVELDLRFDIRHLKTTVQRAMFAIWLITNHLQLAQAVKLTAAYHVLKEKYPRIPDSEAAFRKALRIREGEKRFAKTNTGEFYLLPLGEQEVLSWVEGSRATSENAETDEG